MVGENLLDGLIKLLFERLGFFACQSGFGLKRSPLVDNRTQRDSDLRQARFGYSVFVYGVCEKVYLLREARYQVGFFLGRFFGHGCIYPIAPYPIPQRVEGQAFLPGGQAKVASVGGIGCEGVGLLGFGVTPVLNRRFARLQVWPLLPLCPARNLSGRGNRVSVAR